MSANFFKLWMVFVGILLLAMATTTTAPLVTDQSPSMTSAVQEPLSPDEAIALRDIERISNTLQGIERILNRFVELLASPASWIKVSVIPLAMYIVSGAFLEHLKIFTEFLKDLLKKTSKRWKDLIDSPVENLMIAEVGQMTAHMNEVVTTCRERLEAMENRFGSLSVWLMQMDFQSLKTKVEELQMKVQSLIRTAEENLMAMRIADVEKQLTANLNVVADLRAQLDETLNSMATTTVNVKKKEEDAVFIDEFLRDGDLHFRRSNPSLTSGQSCDITEPIQSFEEGVITAAYASRRATGFLSD